MCCLATMRVHATSLMHARQRQDGPEMSRPRKPPGPGVIHEHLTKDPILESRHLQRCPGRGCTPPLHPSPRVQTRAIHCVVGCGRVTGALVVWCVEPSELVSVCAVLCVVKFGSVAFADEYSGTLNSVEEFRYLLTLRPLTSCACRLITCLRSTIGLTPRACRDGGRPGAVSYRNIKIKATFLWLLYAEQQRRERTDTVCWSSRVPPGPRNGARKHGCAGFPSQLCWCVLTPPSSLASAVVPLR